MQGECTQDALKMGEADKLERWAQDEMNSASTRGHTRELTHPRFQQIFRGRMWDAGNANEWFFQESFTGITVHVEIPDKVRPDKTADWLNGKLYKAMRQCAYWLN
jgi:hypothetical protein